MYKFWRIPASASAFAHCKNEESKGDKKMNKQFNAMRENATFKEMAKICEKYGYELNRAFLRKLGSINQKVVEIGIKEKEGKDICNFTPRVYYSNEFILDSNIDEYFFEIQTTSYGALKKEEYKEFLQAQQNAIQLVEELEKLDLSTLYTIERQ